MNLYVELARIIHSETCHGDADTCRYYEGPCGNAASAILLKYGVVELPEPTDHWAEGPEWRDGNAVVWTAPGGTVMVQNVEPGDLSPDQARALAAALLAAADRAEGKG